MPARFHSLPHLVFASFIAFATGALPSTAQETAQPQRPLPLYEQLAGNTITGYTSEGVKFTEYHSPDGRIFGFNNGRPASDACWRTAGPNIVCYYYDRSRNTRRELCWRFEPVADIGFKIYFLDRPVTGALRLEKGNPYNLSDQGQAWTCDALMVENNFSRPTRFNIVSIAHAIGR